MAYNTVVCSFFLVFSIIAVHGQYQLPIPYQQPAQQIYPYWLQQANTYPRYVSWNPLSQQYGRPVVVPQSYPMFAQGGIYPQMNQGGYDPYAHIPTEIIDLDQQNGQGSYTTQQPSIQEMQDSGKEETVHREVEEREREIRPIVEVVTTAPSDYVIQISNSTKVEGTGQGGYHLVESKPISTHIRRVFTNDGTGSVSKVYTINIVNGVEVTTTEDPNAIADNNSGNNEVVDPNEDDDLEINAKDDKDDGKQEPDDVLRWPSLFH